MSGLVFEYSWSGVKVKQLFNPLFSIYTHINGQNLFIQETNIFKNQSFLKSERKYSVGVCIRALSY